MSVVQPSFAISNQVRTLERVRIVTPLGIRFWDPSLDTPVDDGLIVRASLDGRRDPPRQAFRTRSGIYAFQGLPGLHDAEYPSNDEAFAASPAQTLRFTIQVDDEQRRFLPTAFRVDVPYQGIFPTETPSSPGAAPPPGVYLFSASTRQTPSTLAVIRAQLVDQRDPVGNAPAAFAVLEIQLPGLAVVYGVADVQGSVLVLFPYPAFSVTPATPSPPSGLQQSWPVAVRVRYAPSSLVFPPGSVVPDLRTILSQPLGQVWPTSPSNPAQAVSELNARVFFGQPLVLRTDTTSILVVGSATSP